MPFKINVLVLLFFLALLCQKFLVIRQMNSIVNHIKELSKNGVCGYGIGRNRFGFRKYYLIVADKDGNIINAEKMEGWSVFAKFRPDENIKEKNLYEICTDEENLEKLNALEMAKVQAAKNLKSKLARSENF